MAAHDRHPTRLPAPVTAVLALGLATAALAGACGGGVDRAEGTTEAPSSTAAATTATVGAPSTTSTSATDPGAADTLSTTTVVRGDVPPADPPGDLGDDPQLDALADDCFSGRFAACDQLFYDSDEGSRYEAYGDSCGGRNEPAGLCVTIYGQG